MDEFQYDLFLSHSGADNVWARRLATQIEQRKCQERRLKVFLDKRDIQPGENWVAALQNALRVSRRIGIVLSPEAMQSPWVQEELAVAMNLGLSAGQRRLIPLLLRDCDLPPFLAQLQWIDFRDSTHYADALEELISVLCEWPLSLLTELSPSSSPTPYLTSRELRKRIRDQLMQFSEEQIKDFFYFELNQNWDDFPGSWKGPKIRGIIEAYGSLEGDYGLRKLLSQVELYVEKLRTRLGN